MRLLNCNVNETMEQNNVFLKQFLFSFSGMFTPLFMDSSFLSSAVKWRGYTGDLQYSYLWKRLDRGLVVELSTGLKKNLLLPISEFTHVRKTDRFSDKIRITVSNYHSYKVTYHKNNYVHEPFSRYLTSAFSDKFTLVNYIDLQLCKYFFKTSKFTKDGKFTSTFTNIFNITFLKFFSGMHSVFSSIYFVIPQTYAFLKIANNFEIFNLFSINWTNFPFTPEDGYLASNDYLRLNNAKTNCVNALKFWLKLYVNKIVNYITSNWIFKKLIFKLSNLYNLSVEDYYMNNHFYFFISNIYSYNTCDSIKYNFFFFINLLVELSVNTFTNKKKYFFLFVKVFTQIVSILTFFLFQEVNAKNINKKDFINYFILNNKILLICNSISILFFKYFKILFKNNLLYLQDNLFIEEITIVEVYKVLYVLTITKLVYFLKSTSNLVSVNNFLYLNKFELYKKEANKNYLFSLNEGFQKMLSTIPRFYSVNMLPDSNYFLLSIKDVFINTKLNSTLYNNINFRTSNNVFTRFEKNYINETLKKDLNFMDYTDLKKSTIFDDLKLYGKSWRNKFFWKRLFKSKKENSTKDIEDYPLFEPYEYERNYNYLKYQKIVPNFRFLMLINLLRKFKKRKYKYFKKIFWKFGYKKRNKIKNVKLFIKKFNAAMLYKLLEKKTPSIYDEMFIYKSNAEKLKKVFPFIALEDNIVSLNKNYENFLKFYFNLGFFKNTSFFRTLKEENKKNNSFIFENSLTTNSLFVNFYKAYIKNDFSRDIKIFDINLSNMFKFKRLNRVLTYLNDFFCKLGSSKYSNVDLCSNISNKLLFLTFFSSMVNNKRNSIVDLNLNEKFFYLKNLNKTDYDDDYFKLQEHDQPAKKKKIKNLRFKQSKIKRIKFKFKHRKNNYLKNRRKEKKRINFIDELPKFNLKKIFHYLNNEKYNLKKFFCRKRPRKKYYCFPKRKLFFKLGFKRIRYFPFFNFNYTNIKTLSFGFIPWLKLKFDKDCLKKNWILQRKLKWVKRYCKNILAVRSRKYYLFNNVLKNPLKYNIWKRPGLNWHRIKYFRRQDKLSLNYKVINSIIGKKYDKMYLDYGDKWNNYCVFSKKYKIVNDLKIGRKKKDSFRLTFDYFKKLNAKNKFVINTFFNFLKMYILNDKYMFVFHKDDLRDMKRKYDFIEGFYLTYKSKFFFMKQHKFKEWFLELKEKYLSYMSIYLSFFRVNNSTCVKNSSKVSYLKDIYLNKSITSLNRNKSLNKIINLFYYITIKYYIQLVTYKVGLSNWFNYFLNLKDEVIKKNNFINFNVNNIMFNTVLLNFLKKKNKAIIDKNKKYISLNTGNLKFFFEKFKANATKKYQSSKFMFLKLKKKYKTLRYLLFSSKVKYGLKWKFNSYAQLLFKFLTVKKKDNSKYLILNKNFNPWKKGILSKRSNNYKHFFSVSKKFWFIDNSSFLKKTMYKLLSGKKMLFLKRKWYRAHGFIYNFYKFFFYKNLFSQIIKDYWIDKVHSFKLFKNKKKKINKLNIKYYILRKLNIYNKDLLYLRRTLYNLIKVNKKFFFSGNTVISKTLYYLKKYLRKLTVLNLKNIKNFVQFELLKGKCFKLLIKCLNFFFLNSYEKIKILIINWIIVIWNKLKKIFKNYYYFFLFFKNKISMKSINKNICDQNLLNIKFKCNNKNITNLVIGLINFKSVINKNLINFKRSYFFNYSNFFNNLNDKYKNNFFYYFLNIVNKFMLERHLSDTDTKYLRTIGSLDDFSYDNLYDVTYVVKHDFHFIQNNTYKRVLHLFNKTPKRKELAKRSVTKIIFWLAYYGAGLKNKVEKEKKRDNLFFFSNLIFKSHRGRANSLFFVWYLNFFNFFTFYRMNNGFFKIFKKTFKFMYYIKVIFDKYFLIINIIQLMNTHYFRHCVSTGYKYMSKMNIFFRFFLRKLLKIFKIFISLINNVFKIIMKKNSIKDIVFEDSFNNKFSNYFNSFKLDFFSVLNKKFSFASLKSFKSLNEKDSAIVNISDDFNSFEINSNIRSIINLKNYFLRRLNFSYLIKKKNESLWIKMSLASSFYYFKFLLFVSKSFIKYYYRDLVVYKKDMSPKYIENFVITKEETIIRNTQIVDFFTIDLVNVWSKNYYFNCFNKKFLEKRYIKFLSKDMLEFYVEFFNFFNFCDLESTRTMFYTNNLEKLDDRKRFLTPIISLYCQFYGTFIRHSNNEFNTNLVWRNKIVSDSFFSTYWLKSLCSKDDLDRRLTKLGKLNKNVSDYSFMYVIHDKLVFLKDIKRLYIYLKNWILFKKKLFRKVNYNKKKIKLIIYYFLNKYKNLARLFKDINDTYEISSIYVRTTKILKYYIKKFSNKKFLKNELVKNNLINYFEFNIYYRYFILKEFFKFGKYKNFFFSNIFSVNCIKKKKIFNYYINIFFFFIQFNFENLSLKNINFGFLKFFGLKYLYQAKIKFLMNYCMYRKCLKLWIKLKFIIYNFTRFLINIHNYKFLCLFSKNSKFIEKNYDSLFIRNQCLNKYLDNKCFIFDNGLRSRLWFFFKSIFKKTKNLCNLSFFTNENKNSFKSRLNFLNYRLNVEKDMKLKNYSFVTRNIYSINNMFENKDLLQYSSLILNLNNFYKMQLLKYLNFIEKFYFKSNSKDNYLNRIYNVGENSKRNEYNKLYLYMKRESNLVNRNLIGGKYITNKILQAMKFYNFRPKLIQYAKIAELMRRFANPKKYVGMILKRFFWLRYFNLYYYKLYGLNEFSNNEFLKKLKNFDRFKGRNLLLFKDLLCGRYYYWTKHPYDKNELLNDYEFRNKKIFNSLNIMNSVFFNKDNLIYRWESIFNKKIYKIWRYIYNNKKFQKFYVFNITRVVNPEKEYFKKLKIKKKNYFTPDEMEFIKRRALQPYLLWNNDNKKKKSSRDPSVFSKSYFNPYYHLKDLDDEEEKKKNVVVADSKSDNKKSLFNDENKEISNLIKKGDIKKSFFLKKKNDYKKFALLRSQMASLSNKLIDKKYYYLLKKLKRRFISFFLNFKKYYINFFTGSAMNAYKAIIKLSKFYVKNDYWSYFISLFFKVKWLMFFRYFCFLRLIFNKCDMFFLTFNYVDINNFFKFSLNSNEYEN